MKYLGSDRHVCMFYRVPNKCSLNQFPLWDAMAVFSLLLLNLYNMTILKKRLVCMGQKETHALLFA